MADRSGGPGENQDLASPRDFDREVAAVRPEDLRGTLRISADLGRHLEWLMNDAEMGFDEAYLHHVGPDPRGFIHAFAAHVLPAFAR
jgi:coenzyme F420-dependent glucose-6-phosphate dehydrogenase